MNIARLTQDQMQRKATLEQAAANSRLSAKAIEKDWWVTLTLRALFSTPYAPFCILKGGISLSKGWNFLQRFSDDIDIALMPEVFGMPYQPEPTFAYLGRLKKNGHAFVSTLMKYALVEAFEKLGLSEPDIIIGVANVKKKDPTTIFIRYRSVLSQHSRLTENIKIEFSVRSLKDPFSNVPLHSILSASFPHEMYKEESFIAQVVSPHKTLLEKMFLLHEKFRRKAPAPRHVDGQSRHMYDIVQLINTPAGPAALADVSLYRALIQHRRNYGRLRNVDYDTLNHAELYFIPSGQWIEKLRNDYELIRSSLIYGEAVSFDQLMKQLRIFNGKLRLAGG